MNAFDAKTKRWLTWIIGGTALFLVSLLFGFWVFAKQEPANKELTALKDSASFPVYYPKPLPQGFNLAGTPPSSANNLAIYQIVYKDTTISVTQQQRPKIMEEVNKVKQWPAPTGEAYIADLDGHMTGFIKTDKTLIIFSSTEKLEAELLAQLMNSMSQL